MSKRFFIDNVDCYLGQALLDEVRASRTNDEDNLIFATLKDHDAIDKPLGVRKFLHKEKKDILAKYISDSDYIIYDLHESDFQDVEDTIKTLKFQKMKTPKTLICISTVMTWAKTPFKEYKPKDEDDPEAEEGEGENEEDVEDLIFQLDQKDVDTDAEEEEEAAPEGEGSEGEEKAPPKKYLPFKETEYALRRPSSNYQTLKRLETLALSTGEATENLNVYVLCAGILYGNGERSFNDLFRQAWLQNPEHLRYIAEGNNFIPTIHVRDVAGLVSKVITKQPENHYLFCIDNAKKPTQRRLVTAISKGIGTGLVESVEEDKSIPEIFRINLHMMPCKLLTEQEEIENEEGDVETIGFKWWCDGGLAKNISKLNEEFNRFRGLKPIKIFLTGPPASGKTLQGHLLAKHFNVPYINAQSIADYLPRVKNTELVAEIKEKLEELKTEMAEEAEANKPEGDDTEIDPDQFQPRIPDEYMYQLLRLRLTDNACHNRGYILDGFPRSYNDAKKVFLHVPAKGDDEDQDEEGGDDDLDDDDDDKGNLVIDNDIYPQSVIVLQGDDQFLIERVRNLPEDMVAGTHYNEEDMERRLETYHRVNDSEIGLPSVSEFFAENLLEVLKVPSALERDEIFERMLTYAERHGRPFNYLTVSEEIETQRIKKLDDAERIRQRKQREEERRENIIEEEEREVREERVNQTKNAIEEREQGLIDQRSEPLRTYLEENLVPFLSEGLAEVCRRTPEDPVDFLAEYLFRMSVKVKFPDPSTY